MWIYYHAIFGPGHQSREYGFRYFHDDYSDEDIKEHLFDEHYDIVLNFWEVKRPPAEYIANETKTTKEKIKRARKYLKMLESTTCFVPEQKEEEDPVLIRNISGCIISDLLKRLHSAGFMYGAEDISNWRCGKKCLTEPNRTKILSIMRKTKKYPPIKEQLGKKK